ncbi:hypothetical protein ACF0H5_018690 [Mactra antiquata]
MDRDTLNNILEEKVAASLEQHKHSMLEEMSKIFEKISENSASKVTNLLSTNVPTFKRKSNEEQFKYNAKVSCILEEADMLMQNSKIDESRRKIAEGDVLFLSIVIFVKF